MSTKQRLVSFLAALAFLCLGFAADASAQSGGLKGTVRANNGGTIAGATVTIRKDGRDLKTARSDAKGKFVIEGIPAGSYNVLFDADGFGSGVLYNVEVKGSRTRDLGDRLILSPDQGSQVIIKGSVFYREGTSVTGAKVEIERIDADGSARKIGTAVTNISGEFTFRQPRADAKFRITAKFKGASGSKELTVTNAAIYWLAITLELSRSQR